MNIRLYDYYTGLSLATALDEIRLKKIRKESDKNESIENKN